MKKDDLILITIDALRYDSFMAKSNSFFKSLGRNYILFENAFGNGCGTSRAFFSIMCSSYPLAFGKQLSLSKYEKTLAEVLKENGYYTIGLNAANPFLSSHFGYHRGFNFFDDYMSFKGKAVPGSIQWYIVSMKNLFLGRPNYPRASRILSDALEIWSNSPDGQPKFMWVHLMDTHQPWLPPSWNYPRKLHYVNCNLKFRKIAKIYKGEKIESLKNNKKVIECQHIYELTVDYLISELQYFLPNFSNTWVVVLSDHGEAFGEMGIIGHPPRLYDITLHVPLLIFPPTGYISENIYIKEIFSIIDLPPTIIDMIAGISEKRFMGVSRNVFEKEGSLYSYSEALKEDGTDNVHINSGTEVLSVRTKSHRIVMENNEYKIYDSKCNNVCNEKLLNTMLLFLKKIKSDSRRLALSIRTQLF